MPCYDPETHERPKRLDRKVNRLTAMLCSLCGKLQAEHPAILEENPEILEWWTKHRAHDERISSLKERRWRDGIDSLTMKERDELAFADFVEY
jgi:hypothetical protein